MKFNKETLKSALRSGLAVLVGVALVLAGDPKYAPVAAFLPFVLRFVDKSDPSIGLGKELGKVLDPKASN